MPLGSKRSRAAKHTYQNAPEAFATHAPYTASPEGLEYLVLDNSSDGLVIDVKSGTESDIQRGNEMVSSVEAL